MKKSQYEPLVVCHKRIDWASPPAAFSERGF
jgi:hypothetical protein